MKKSDLACRIIFAATATALCAMPLLACGDDGDNLQGEWVSERKWESGIDALLACKNYTETITGHQVTEQVGQVYDTIGNITYKFDIDNNVIFVSSSVHHPPFSYTPFTAYEFGCTVNNPDTDELETWCICVYCNEATKNKWEALDEGIVDPSEFKSNFLLTKGKNSLVSEIIGSKSIDIKSRYKESKFNTDDSSFTYEFTSYKFLQADNISLIASSSSFKLYFSGDWLYGFGYKDKTEVTTQYKNNNIFHYTTTQDMTTICSNFGTTAIDVPDEVKTVLENYKATHNPYTEEE